MAADEEVGARLRLKDRAQFQRDADAASRSVRDIGDSADKADAASRRMVGGTGLASKGLQGLVSVAKVGVTAVAGLAAGVGFLGVKTIGLAMDAAETGSKFNTVFAGMEADVGGFVKQMNADYGIPTRELQDAASTFGVFAKAAGLPSDSLAAFSKDLTGAGLDLASFYNAEPGEVFLALRSGLAGGAEPLRKFGIFLSDATMKAQAAQMGLTGELTESQKVMVRQAIIMKSLGDAQGDMERTSGGLANQWKGLKGRLEEAGTAIGTAFLPMATMMVNVLNTQLQPAVAWLQNRLPGIVSTAAGAIDEAGIRARDAWNMGGSIGETVAAFTGMSAIEGPVNRVADALGDVWVILRDGIGPAFATVGDSVFGFTSPLNAADAILDALADNAAILHPLLVGMVVAWGLWKTAVIAHNVVMAVSGGLMAARVGVTMLLTGTTGLNTAAELTRNQALLASIALHARMAAALVVSIAQTIAHTAGLAAHAVVMGVVRTATMAWTAAQWLLNTALTMNPIGLIIVAIGLLVAAFVLAWKNSETFRNIVTGAFNKVRDAAIAVKDWIVDSFNTVVTFFSGMGGKISAVAGGTFDGLKGAFKGAVNFIIDGWNRLEFKIPEIDTHIPGIGKVGGMSIGTPNIPRLHTGGTTTSGGAAIIQPREEMVILPPVASVVPLDGNVRAASGAATGGQQPIVMQVVLDRKVLAEAVYDHTGDKVARR